MTQFLTLFQSQGPEEGCPVFDRLSKDDRKHRRCHSSPGVPLRCHRSPAFQGLFQNFKK
jgi:hypothetical protein